VNRRLVLVGLVIDGQSEGHGVTPLDLSTESGQPQSDVGAFYWTVLAQKHQVG
jgi:hypothetical protein